MNEDLINIIKDIFEYNDLESTDLYDNTIYEDIKMIILDTYSQFTSISTNDDLNSINKQIDKLLYHRQHMPIEPCYSNSELLYLENKIKYLGTIPQPEQRSEEWHIFRNNRLTASDFYGVIDEGAISRRNELIMKKCGADIPFLTNDAILHGIKFEQLATEIYEKRNNIEVLEFGCIPHPIIPFFGASPDGIVSYNSKNKPYVGRMLEIKCPKSRKITGIIPDGYYAQIQGQLEVCDLEYCDYLECDFQKYKSKSDFFEEDDEFKEKGMIVELYNIKLKKHINYYSKKHHINSKEEFEKWEDSIISTIYEDDDLEYVTTTYWYLNKYNVVLVNRDKSYFMENYGSIKKFWDDVLHYRNIGIDSFIKDKEEKKKKKNNNSLNSGWKEKELEFLD